MPSEVDICNRALSAMGTRSTIASLTEISNEARACSIHYESVRDELLGMALWNFARRVKALAVLKSAIASSVWDTTKPAPGWAYSYGYPTDCIRARFVLPQTEGAVINGVPIFDAITGRYDAVLTENPPVPFLIAGDDDGSGNDIKVILANEVGTLLVYTRRVTNPNVWDAQFTQALVAVLATRLAIPLTGDKELLKMNYQIAEDSVGAARVKDGNEGLTIQQTDPDWITIRG